MGNNRSRIDENDEAATPPRKSNLNVPHQAPSIVAPNPNVNLLTEKELKEFFQNSKRIRDNISKKPKQPISFFSLPQEILIHILE